MHCACVVIPDFRLTDLKIYQTYFAQACYVMTGPGQNAGLGWPCPHETAVMMGFGDQNHCLSSEWRLVGGNGQKVTGNLTARPYGLVSKEGNPSVELDPPELRARKPKTENRLDKKPLA